MTPLVVPPETWVRIPGSNFEVWHRQHRNVVITDHYKGAHGLGLRIVPTTGEPTDA
jgi:hypothetical protein